MTYGDGAVMGVPAHDERDFAFAKKYGIAIKQVVAVKAKASPRTHAWAEWYGDKQKCVTVNSGKYDGLNYKAAVDAVAAGLAAKVLAKPNHLAFARLGISRQRYWGTPSLLSIAMIAVMYRCLMKICPWYCQRNVFQMVRAIH